MDSFHEICAALTSDIPVFSTTLITEREIQSPSITRKDLVRNLFLLWFAFSEKVVIRQNTVKRVKRCKNFRLRLYMTQGCTYLILAKLKNSPSLFCLVGWFVFFVSQQLRQLWSRFGRWEVLSILYWLRKKMTVTWHLLNSLHPRSNTKIPLINVILLKARLLSKKYPTTWFPYYLFN